MDMETRSKQEPHVSRGDIARALRAVGVRQGDTAFAHSSLSAFGYVEGGADAVIDALLDALGPSGTLVLPTFTWGPFHKLDSGVFDVANTPCETGRIPETFRKRPGVVRSAHVCHSVAAWGPKARFALGEDFRSFGPGSVFDRLHQLDSWYLLLGVGFNSCTALHMVEEYEQVPYRRYRDFKKFRVVLPDGRTVPSSCVEFLKVEGYRNDFSKAEPLFFKEGLLKTCQAGKARIVNARLRDIFRVARKEVGQDPGYLLAPESQKRLRNELLPFIKPPPLAEDPNRFYRCVEK